MNADYAPEGLEKLFRIIQFTDSAFPVGTFTFSNGLETAAHLGIVHDAASLRQYAASAASQAAFTDGVIALLAYRAAVAGDYGRVIAADQKLMLFKMNAEARLMLCRMGKKLAELGVRLYGKDSLFGRWLADCEAGVTPGTYPVAQALAFAQEELGEQALYVAHQYGVINMILSAALRLVRVSHYDTQAILFELGKTAERDYERARDMDFENMHSFVPEMDIFASLHEKGKMRMFMN
ncbi:MAG: urease accessory protein UreF [Desulfovibrio sp.]|nr:urease accessory protein UreF [Desulfovibrio sp.]